MRLDPCDVEVTKRTESRNRTVAMRVRRLPLRLRSRPRGRRRCGAREGAERTQSRDRTPRWSRFLRARFNDDRSGCVTNALRALELLDGSVVTALDGALVTEVVVERAVLYFTEHAG